MKQARVFFWIFFLLCVSTMAQAQGEKSSFPASVPTEIENNSPEATSTETEKFRGPEGSCRQEIIEKTYAELGGHSDGSLEDGFEKHERWEEYELGKCLVKKGQYALARTILLSIAHNGDESGGGVDKAELYWKIALAEEKIGLKTQSQQHIHVMYDVGNFATYEIDDVKLTGEEAEMYRDYKRINAQSIAKQEKESKEYQLKSSFSFWDQASSDEREILHRNGGTRSNNGAAQPCHIEQFSARGHYTETWWYGGCSSGVYLKAYTFTNGRLTSIYSP